MDRLDFSLPDFTRLSWVSDPAREVWEPRLQQITKAWLEIEWLSVAEGVRRCGVTVVSPEELIDRAGEWVKHGLNVLPVEIQGTSSSSYASTAVETELGKPFAFRIVIGVPQNTADFKQAWDATDDEEIGSLLGYPACCHQFFKQVWVEQGMLDTTWPMAAATTAPSDSVTALAVSGPPEANILWRWMGVRAVSHLPCRFDCELTVALGKQLIEVGQEHGYEREMDWLLEILSWPVEWSALHGIAEIKTPVLKVSTRTDATAQKYIVRRTGDSYPSQGARGLNFPYSVPAGLRLTESHGFQEGLSKPIEPTEQQAEWYASDNGFQSIIAMNKAHQPIVELALATLTGQGGLVLDLGCGNGALLEKISKGNETIVPFGADIGPDKIEHARTLLPDFADNFILGDMFENEQLWAEGRQYALIILMPGRLLEAGPERAATLREKLRQGCDHLLVYTYGDWSPQYRGLSELAQAAGLSLLTPAKDVGVSLATVR